MASVLLIALIISFMLLRPYSTDWARYVWWRVMVASVETGYVQSDDARILYHIVGAGPPLILLHGGLSSSIDWYAQLPELSKNFQVVLIDSRGHGGSTLGSQPLNYELLANDVKNVLDYLAFSKVDLVGWSDGGNIGLLLLSNHPEYIRKLVAISANAEPSGLTDDAVSSIEDIDPERPSLFTQILYHLQSPVPSKLPDVTQQVVSMWRGYPKLSKRLLASFHTPILLIIGENDDVTLKHVRNMKAALPDAILHIVQSVGHNVPQAGSDEITHKIIGFLQP